MHDCRQHKMAEKIEPELSKTGLSGDNINSAYLYFDFLYNL